MELKKQKMSKITIHNKYITRSFISILQKRGLKELSENILRNTLSHIKKTTKKKPLYILLSALKNAKPFCEVKSLRISGTNYKIPTEIKTDRQKTLVLRWVIRNSFNRAESNIKTSIAKEIIDTYNLSSKTIKTCDEFHKIAESNKIFVQIRY